MDDDDKGKKTNLNMSIDTYVKPPRRRTITPFQIRRRILRLSKKLYHKVKYDADERRQIVFVVGCQRSGTDLMTWIFERDWQTKVFPEVSKLSSRDVPERLRLNPLVEVKAALAAEQAPLVALKPLVESQRTAELLDYFPNSKALWLYRDYKAVAHSHVKKWGGRNSIRDLWSIVKQKPDDWRYENVSDELYMTVTEHFAQDMGDYDAAALYWYVRNHLFFDLQLDQDSRVMLCRYETLVRTPILIVEQIYNFLKRDFPGRSIVAEVHADSIDKGRNITLSPAIEGLCLSLLAGLDDARARANARLSVPGFDLR